MSLFILYVFIHIVGALCVGCAEWLDGCMDWCKKKNKEAD